MRNRLLIGFAALLVCGANVALAQREQVPSRFACSDFDCDGDNDCADIGCGDCGTTPNGKQRCEAEATIE